MGKCCCHINGIEIKDGKARPFPNVLEMKVCKYLVEGNTITTNGYYVPGDGGRATYLIRKKLAQDIEDGGKIIFTKNELVAELLKEDSKVFNARQYGAMGNTTNDDTKAIQTMLDNHSYVVIADGIYMVSDELKLKNNQTLILRNATILSTLKDSTKAILKVENKSNVNIFGENGVVKYASMGEGQTGIKVENSKVVKIKGLEITNVDLGIELIGSETSDTSVVIIRDNIFRHTDELIYTIGDISFGSYVSNVNAEDNYTVTGTSHNPIPPIDDGGVDLGEPDDGEDNTEDLPGTGTTDPDHNDPTLPDDGTDDEVDLGEPTE